MQTELGSYDFLSPAKIVFGWGRRRETGTLARSLGRRAAIVWGSRTLRASPFAEEILFSLYTSDVEAIELATITHEPLVADVDAASWALNHLNLGSDTFLLAIGGGAAIDLGKAVAAMATNWRGTTVQDFLEGVGQGFKIEHPPLPLFAIPTTAGTGSEATKNAVISSLDPPFKKSLRSEQMLAKIVLVDPELTTTCPPAVTAHSGMDAITQCVESYVSRKANPISRALAADGFVWGMRSIVEAYENGSSRSAREGMAHAALLSGMALANSGLGVAHGVAAALGVQHEVPHGLACAMMLCPAIEANLQVASHQFAQLERLLGGSDANDSVLAKNLLHRMCWLCEKLGVPSSLSKLGVTHSAIVEIARGSRGNSLDGNPRAFSESELVCMLEGVL